MSFSIRIFGPAQNILGPVEGLLFFLFSLNVYSIVVTFWISSINNFFRLNYENRFKMTSSVPY